MAKREETVWHRVDGEAYAYKRDYKGCELFVSPIDRRAPAGDWKWWSAYKGGALEMAPYPDASHACTAAEKWAYEQSKAYK